MENVERGTWSRHDVEARLVAAFMAMPALPVFLSEARLQATGIVDDGAEVTTTLQWAAFLTDDAGARKFLWTWARCKATRTSFAELCRGMGWPRATAEAGRRRAAATIAARLSCAHAGDDRRDRAHAPALAGSTPAQVSKKCRASQGAT